MKRFVLGLSAVVCLAFAALAAEPVTTPLQKVVAMLEEMVSQGTLDKREEQKQFVAFHQWCDDVVQRKNAEISAGGLKEEELKAAIGVADATVGELELQVRRATADIQKYEENKVAATNVRGIDHQDFLDLDKNWEETLQALDMAINHLHTVSQDVPQNTSFTQLSAVRDMQLIPEKARKAIDAFLQQPVEVANPKANAYEFQSHGIIDMMEKLKTKFIEERHNGGMEEQKSLAAYDKLMQSMTNGIEHTAANKRAMQERINRLRQQRAQDAGELSDTQATLKADNAYLQDTMAQCSSKATAYEKRQKLRADELKVLHEAVDILKNPKVAVGMPSSSAAASGTLALAQLRSLSVAAPQRRAADYLQVQGSKLHSHMLAVVAEKIQANPFAKVIEMLKSLIFRLQEQESEAITHKGWCDTQLATNEATRTEETTKLERLHVQIDELTATAAQLEEDITGLVDGIASIDKAVSEATIARAAERAQNDKTIKEAKESREEVARALQLLREFYAQASEATAFVQKERQEPPPIFGDTPYRGMVAQKGGVVGLLEVISSDLVNLEVTTTTAEEAARQAHEQFLTESQVDRAQKDTDMNHKRAQVVQKTADLKEAERDHEASQAEKAAAEDYYTRLKSSCINTELSHEERHARRQEEIESLQEALRILNGEEFAR